jgi:tetratricopeptide (TPR) repeat protein
MALRGEFANFLLGSVCSCVKDKMSVCENLDNIEVSKLKRYIKNLKNEKVVYTKELYNEFSKVLALGIIEDTNNIEYLIKLSEGDFKNDWSVFWILGSVYSDKKEYDKAIVSYKKAIEINPKYDDAYNNMGYSYEKKGEYDKAIASYKKAIEINPENDKAYYNMGVAYYWLKEFNKTIECYSKALEINPNNSLSYTNLFELQLTQNQPFNKELEKEYIKRFQEKKETFIHYEMLKIFQAIAQGNEVDLEGWKQKYSGVGLDWSFDELREWIGGVEDREVRGGLEEASGVFEGW